MKKLAVFLAAVLFGQAALADTIEGKVVGVADGDTITSKLRRIAWSVGLERTFNEEENENDNDGHGKKSFR